jgi:hypothetical protein
MKNIKVRYFAFVSLLLTLFTTAIIEYRRKKTLHSLNHSILLSHRFFAVKKSNTHVEIDVEEIQMQSIIRLGRKQYVGNYMSLFFW